MATDAKGRPARADDVTMTDLRAQMSLQPALNATLVVEAYAKPMGELDLKAVMDHLAASIQAMSAGNDTTRAEGMLLGQAHALQAIFVNLARRATKQDDLKHWEALLRMALKAQNQSRMTLESLASIKNPSVVIARQANINHGGQQQVNNGVAAPTTPRSEVSKPEPARAGENNPAANELLEPPR